MYEEIFYLPIIVSIFGVIVAVLARLKDFKKKSKLLKVNDYNLGENEILSTEANKAIRKLIQYARHTKIDYIIGINRGGILVASYAALHLSIPTQNVVRCVVNVKNQNVVSDIEKISGRALIVDDICRTGATMDLAIKHIKNKYNPEIVDAAVLIAFTNQEGNIISNHLGFYAHETHAEQLILPWARSKTTSDKSKNARLELEEIKKKPISEWAWDMGSIANAHKLPHKERTSIAG